MNKQPQSKVPKGGWLFLAAVVLAYLAVAVMDVSLAQKAWLFFTGMFVQLIPALLLVFVLMVAVNLLVTPKRIDTYLGKASGYRGWLLAAVGGVFSTGPIYTWYILLRDLKGKGMKMPLIAVFLYSRAVKLPLLPLLIHYFGLAYTLVLSFYLICFSMVSGVVMELIAREDTRSG
jgi:uncharacterized membrane protein YraQ (UPF0718 family)